MVLWLCGLSGSGKTTLGRLVYARLKAKAPNIVLLDGEDVRAAFGGDLGHDPAARRRNSVRIGNLCRLLDGQGIHVVCCAMTIAPEVQAMNREHLTGYCEVLLNVSLEVLASRDPKGIYRRARAGQLTQVCGVDIPYVAPTNPHLVLDNNRALQNLSPLVDRILAVASFDHIW